MKNHMPFEDWVEARKDDAEAAFRAPVPTREEMLENIAHWLLIEKLEDALDQQRLVREQAA